MLILTPLYNALDNAEILDRGRVRVDGSRITSMPGWPKRDANGKYFEPTKYQLISVGRSRYCRSTNPATERVPSDDDITNFLK